MGPRLEFRIIDFGSSFFSEELAQATGGVRARENYRRLTRLFEGAEVAFWSPAKSTKIQLQRAELTPRDADRDQGWHLPTNLCQRASATAGACLFAASCVLRRGPRCPR